MAWTIEDRLILAILKLLFQERNEVVEEIQALIRSGIRNEAFLQASEREGVAGLLYFILLHHHRAQGLLPSQIVDRLKTTYYGVAAKNLQLLQHLAMVLDRLEAEKIRTIVWKGAALLEDAYPSPGARGMCDVDLVVTPDEFIRVKEILERLGFSSPPTHPHLFATSSLSLDLHRDIIKSTWGSRAKSYGVPLKVEDLWERGCPWRENSAAIRRLSPGDTVLTLSAHLQRHSFTRLIWFVDIGQVIHHQVQQGRWTEKEWDAIIERAEAVHLRRCLSVPLQFLHQVLDFPLPSKMLHPANRPRRNVFERIIFHMVLKGRRFEPLGELLFLFSVPGLAGKWRFLLDLISPKPEALPPALHSRWLSPLAYVLRLGRMMKLASMALARSVKGR